MSAVLNDVSVLLEDPGTFSAFEFRSSGLLSALLDFLARVHATSSADADADADVRVCAQSMTWRGHPRSVVSHTAGNMSSSVLACVLGSCE